MYAYALLDAEKMMTALGRTGLSEEYRGRREKLLSRIQECCYDPKKGLFREGPDFFQYFPRHAQAGAVLCGFFEGGEARKFLQRALDDLEVLKCSFSTSYEWFRAMEKSGMTEEIQKEIY